MYKRNQQGVTLLEILLVLVIASSLIYLGVRQYQLFRLDVDAQQLKYNVDTIFKAMSAYYNANCYGQTNPSTGVLTPGSLHPNSSPSNPFIVNIATQLDNGGFIQEDIPLSNLVDTSGAGTPPYKGYVAQFNRATDQLRTTSSIPGGTIVFWTIQVSVLVENPINREQYKNLLNADCLSTASGGGVAPCGGAAGNYLVWERLPSFSAGKASNQSLFWETTPTAKQFKQMYTTYPIIYLKGPWFPNQVPGPGGAGHQPQYFLCGG